MHQGDPFSEESMTGQADITRCGIDVRRHVSQRTVRRKRGMATRIDRYLPNRLRASQYSSPTNPARVGARGRNRAAGPVLLVSLPAINADVMAAEALGRPVVRLTLDLQRRLVARAIGRVTAHELGQYQLRRRVIP